VKRPRLFKSFAVGTGVLGTIASIWWFALRPRRKQHLDWPIRSRSPSTRDPQWRRGSRTSEPGGRKRGSTPSSGSRKGSPT